MEINSTMVYDSIFNIFRELDEENKKGKDNDSIILKSKIIMSALKRKIFKEEFELNVETILLNYYKKVDIYLNSICDKIELLGYLDVNYNKPDWRKLHHKSFMFSDTINLIEKEFIRCLGLNVSNYKLIDEVEVRSYIYTVFSDLVESTYANVSQ